MKARIAILHQRLAIQLPSPGFKARIEASGERCGLVVFVENKGTEFIEFQHRCLLGIDRYQRRLKGWKLLCFILYNQALTVWRQIP